MLPTKKIRPQEFFEFFENFLFWDKNSSPFQDEQNFIEN